MKSHYPSSQNIICCLRGKKKKDGVLLYGDSDLLTYFVFVLAARKFRGEFGTHVNNGADLSGIHIYGLTLFLTS